MGTNFQIMCVNVDGLGIHRKSKLRRHATPPIIKELISNAKNIPTLFCTLETQLRSDHRYIKLPKSTHYLKESSGDECTRNKGGIFIFSDHAIQIKDKNTDAIVIQSLHSIYIKMKFLDNVVDVIFVYLPHQTKYCIESLNIIDKFIADKQLTNFVIMGDFNTSFESKQHSTKAQKLSAFLSKYNLFDVANKLGVHRQYTWRGRGQRISSKSTIDHAFANFELFNKIIFTHNSFSDHLTLTLGVKKKFLYSPPKWKPFLFNDPEFLNLMKIETLKFLALNSDENIVPDNFEDLCKNDLAEDVNFTFENLEFKSTSALFTLVRHLKQHHDKFYSKVRLKAYNKTKEFDKKMSHLIEIMDNSVDLNKQQEIRQLILTQQEYFKNLVQIRAETNYIRAIVLDGKSNSLTYRHIRKNKGINYNLLINGQMCDSHQKIANTFAETHAEIVSPQIEPISNLESLLENYGLSLEKIYPQIKNITSPYSSHKEYKEVISSMRSTSSPGISSEPKALYKFLFDFLPTFSTEAFNRIYDINIDESPFKFLKDRNITFLPKKGMDLSNPLNYRPISLCEVPYKILTKAINKKVSPYLSTILHSEQFGFTPGKQMSTASASILATFEYIKEKKIDAQFLSVDIQRAYDKALNSVVNVLIKFIFPEGNFAKGWTNLTSGGRFRAVVSNHFSIFYDLVVSISQGRPDAPAQFNILHKIFMACLESTKIKNITLKIEDKNIPCGGFADDTWCFLQMKSEKDVQIIKKLLCDMEESVGLKVNFNKTKILTHGVVPQGLAGLGNVVPYLKHLGVYIGFDTEKSAELTYTELLQNMERKANNFPMKYGFNVLKRRNVCMTILNSMCYHIYRVYKPNQKQLDKLSKIINKFIWSINRVDGISYRFKVASKRMESKFVQGGLNLLKSENQCFKIWIQSFINCIRHAVKYEKSTLRILFDQREIATQNLLENIGYHSWNENASKLSLIQPTTNKTYLQRAVNFFIELENDKKTFLYTPIASCSFFEKHDIECLSKDEQECLRLKDIHTFASILKYSEISSNKILVIPELKSEIYNEAFNLTLIDKLEKLVIIVKKKFYLFDIMHVAKFRKMKRSLLQFDSKVISFHFKRIIQESFEAYHPAVKTRRDNNIFFPDLESYERSFKMLFSLPIMLYYKSFYFEQISRTLVSKNKIAKFSKNTQNNMCFNCNTVSNLEHELFYCLFPDFFSNALANFLDKRFNDGRPEFIFLRENFYLFNIFYEIFSEIDYLQISLLILVAKDRSLKICKDECFEKFNRFNCISQSILVTQFTSKLLSYANINDDLIVAFSNHIIDNM